MIFAALVGLLLGCGGSSPPTPDAKPTPADPAPPTPTPPPKDETVKKADPVPPPPPAVAWELDTAKHAIPTAPPGGKIAGAAFTPEAEFQGDTLKFRVLTKDGNIDRAVSIQLPPARAKTAADGLSLTIKADQVPGPDVPRVTTEFPPPKAGEPGAMEFANGYALTLELGKRAAGKLPGKLYLSLPGDEKEVVAGTFVADWIRPISELPGPDDVPFVQGSLTVAGDAPQVKLGYAGLPKPDDFASYSVQMALVGPGASARLDYARPRATVVVAAEAAGKPARYEHTKLSPGRYVVYAAVADGGPAAWKWVTVAPDSKLTIDLALDPAKVGKLEVVVPVGTTDKVELAPADEPGTPVPLGVYFGVAATLGLQADPKDGVAKFEKLGPGRYEARAGELAGVVEVKAGETAKLELMPAKK